MTLIFSSKTQHPDTRMIEYDQTVVRLGLEKAVLEKEVGYFRQELKEIGNHYSAVLLNLEDKKKEIELLNTQCNEIRKEISEAILKGSKDAAGLREQNKKSDEVVGKKKSELEKLNLYLISLGKEIETKIIKIAELQNAAMIAREELAKVRNELSQPKREIERLHDDLQSIYKLKIEVVRKLNAAEVERREIEEIVKMLKENNKEGLELVASFEGERRRLQEKDEYLHRKEKDLGIYEERVKKYCDEAGYGVSMVFV